MTAHKTRRFTPRPEAVVRTPLVAPRQRIGIMGGSFNPPHDGHRSVAETALKRLQLDQVWWLVTPGNPLKAHDGLPSQTQRMADIAHFARGPRMKITGFEAELGTPYTAATLAYLKRRFPDVHFVWIMGADNLAHFHRWQRWKWIAQNFPIAIVDRPAWRLKALAGRAAQRYAAFRVNESDGAALATARAPAWIFLTAPLSPLSSTALRANSASEPITPQSI